MTKANDALRTRFLRAKQALFDKAYSHLTEMQRKAVFTIRDPLLVLAGAGSGKTTVLVNRVAYIIRYGNAYFDETLPEGLDEEYVKNLEASVALSPEELREVLTVFASDPCPPWAVLAITFTNKAANEMKTRLRSTIGEYADDVWAGTFHSTCVKMLRKYGESVGVGKGFTIYDSDDTKRALSKCMDELNVDEKALQVRVVQNTISRAKDKLQTPDDMRENSPKGDYKLRQIADIYELYQRRLEESNAVDFDDIIMKTVKMLETCEEARDYYQHRFRYVSVDEFQDTNLAQFRLAVLLSGHYHNLMAVGDDDQSIYKFRGATIENILCFDKNLPNTAVIKLEENFRSTKVILDAANAVIRNNEGRRGKELYTSKKEGEKIVFKRCDNQNDEARYLVNRVTELASKEKRKFSDFAILYRMNAQSNTLESAFSRNNIPYRILGGLRFYERKEIKDILAYLCLLRNPADRMRLRRVINEPKRKIGETTVNTVEEIANLENCSMFEVMERSEFYPALVKSSTKLKGFTEMIRGFAEYAATEKVSDLIREVFEKSGYQLMLLTGGDEGIERMQNVQELITNAVEYEKQSVDEAGNYVGTLDGFLEDVALVSDVDNYDADADAVVMMTIHSAKGLEFPVVMLPGFEEGIFPSILSASDPLDLEEERRLAYVAITRAKERLYIVTAKERLLYGRTNYNPPSRFFREIPEELVQTSETRRELPKKGESPAEKQHAALLGEFMKGASVLSGDSVSSPQPAKSERFGTGDTVVHDRFGRGVVLSVSEMGSDLLYEVMFDTVGTKKLMGNYAKMKRE